MNKKLYVITSFFNPQQFKSRGRLYRNFAKEQANAGVQLLTVEAAFGAHSFEVTDRDNPWNLQLRTDQVIWHKERMLNLGINRLRALVPDVEFIGIYDADVTHANPDWVACTTHALMHSPVVQTFGQCIYLDAQEQEIWNCLSSFRFFKEKRGYHQRPPIPATYLFQGHPGLAWAFTRTALDQLGGLYDLCAAGSGDTVMCNALKGGWDQFLPVTPTTGMLHSMKRWAARCDAVIKTNVGWVPGAILHHWHGSSETRGYEKRWAILAFHKFDPLEDLVLDSQGLYRWAGNKPELEDDLRLSLASRKEDA